METIKSLQSKLVIIYIGLLFGMVSFGGVVVFGLKPDVPTNHPSTNTFLIISTVLLVGGIAAGTIIGNNRLKELRETPIEEASQSYISVCIIRFAAIEGPVIFSIVALLLTGENLFLIFIGVGIAYFGYLFPSKGKIEKELAISEDQFSL